MRIIQIKAFFYEKTSKKLAKIAKYDPKNQKMTFFFDFRLFLWYHLKKKVASAPTPAKTFFTKSSANQSFAFKRLFVNYTTQTDFCQKGNSENLKRNIWQWQTTAERPATSIGEIPVKFMKLIFVDRTHEERSSLSSSEFYNTAKKISEQGFGVRVLQESPQTLTQDNPLGHHQEFDFYQSLIFDLMSQSEHILNVVSAKLQHFGKECGWELAQSEVSHVFRDPRYANVLPDDWFKKQAWYNYWQNETLRKKSLVKIPAAAFYFARISRDVHKIAREFDVTEWAVRKWAKTFEWHEALNVLDYKGDRRFAIQPTRDAARENGEIFNKAQQAYQEALNAGTPYHKLATIAGERVGLPRRRIHDWAMKYNWRGIDSQFPNNMRDREIMRELNFTDWNQDDINALSDEDYNLLKRAEIGLTNQLQDFLIAYNIYPDEYRGERYIHPLDLSPNVFSRLVNEEEFCVKFGEPTILRHVKSSRDGRMYRIHTGSLRWIKLSDVPKIINRYWNSAYRDKTPDQLQAMDQLVVKQREYMTMLDCIEQKTKGV